MCAHREDTSRPVHILHSAVIGCGRSRALQAEAGCTASLCLAPVSLGLGCAVAGLRNSSSNTAEAGGLNPVSHQSRLALSGPGADLWETERRKLL